MYKFVLICEPQVVKDNNYGFLKVKIIDYHGIMIKRVLSCKLKAMTVLLSQV